MALPEPLAEKLHFWYVRQKPDKHTEHCLPLAFFLGHYQNYVRKRKILTNGILPVSAKMRLFRWLSLDEKCPLDVLSSLISARLQKEN